MKIVKQKAKPEWNAKRVFFFLNYSRKKEKGMEYEPHRDRRACCCRD